jgi:hypothetical protein
MTGNFSESRLLTSGLLESVSEAPCESQIRRSLCSEEVKEHGNALMTHDPPCPQHLPGCSTPLVPWRRHYSAAAPSMGSPHLLCSGGWEVSLWV